MPRYLDLGPMRGALRRVAGEGVPLDQPRVFNPKAPSCAECGPKAIGVLVRGDVLKVGRDGRPYEDVKWVCPNDPDHYVGVHGGSTDALGFLAGKRTRFWRMQVHEVFDPLWRRRQQKYGEARHISRGVLYDWLGKKLGVEPDANGRRKVHIAQLSLSDLRRAYDICKPLADRVKDGTL